MDATKAIALWHEARATFRNLCDRPGSWPRDKRAIEAAAARMIRRQLLAERALRA